jgi:ABC-type nitrate/sulfonate/bicarbonate transport system permease component
MSVRPAASVVTALVVVFSFHPRLRAQPRPAFPAPSDVSDAQNFWQTSRETRGEIAKSYLHPAWLFEKLNP